MKLPEKYKSWVEFAKAVIKEEEALLAEYPDATSKVLIMKIKAKAFDEVMGNSKFSVDDVFGLRNAAYTSGFSAGKGEVFFNLLLSLVE